MKKSKKDKTQSIESVETVQRFYHVKISEDRDAGIGKESSSSVDEDEMPLLADVRRHIIKVTGVEPQTMDGTILNVGLLEEILQDIGYVAFSTSFLETPQQTNELIDIIQSYEFGPIIHPEDHDDSDLVERRAA